MRILTDRRCWWRRRRQRLRPLHACGGLITGEGDIELAILWQAEGSPDGLSELPVPVWTWFHLEAVRPAVKVDVHDCRGVGPTPGSQR